MNRSSIPEPLRAFITAHIPSVPYLEALLLMRSFPGGGWTAAQLGRRLYLSDSRAAELLEALAEDGIAAPAGTADCYCYRPQSSALRDMLDQLALYYASNLVGISKLIHARDQAAPIASQRPQAERRR